MAHHGAVARAVDGAEGNGGVLGHDRAAGVGLPGAVSNAELLRLQGRVVREGRRDQDVLVGGRGNILSDTCYGRRNIVDGTCGLRRIVKPPEIADDCRTMAENRVDFILRVPFDGNDSH